MSEPTARSPVPDGWDFPLDFLQDPDFLPPYVAAHPGAPTGASRATPADVAAFVPGAQPRPARHAVHTTQLPGVFTIVDDPQEHRHRLLPGLALTEELGNRHLLAIGPPGCGKTTQLMLPLTAALLRDRLRSVVVFDGKGDQFPLLRQLALQAGRSSPSVLHLDLQSPQRSIGWNPLRTDLDHAGALAVAAALLAPPDARSAADGAFWRSPALALLVDILLGLQRYANLDRTLPRVREILQLPRPDLLAWLRHHGCQQSAARFDSGHHLADACLADLSLRLLPLVDPAVCAVLSHGELDLERLFKKPMVLVVSRREARHDHLRPLFRLFAQQLFEAAIARADARSDRRLPLPLSIVVDDFAPTCGALPHLPAYLHALRSRRVGVAAAIQGVDQLLSLYGPQGPAALAAFGSKVFFPRGDFGDAELLSRISGSMATPGPDGQPTSRRTFLPEEIQRPREHPVLGRPVTMRLADQVTVQAYLTPSYRQARFQQAQRRAGCTKVPRRRTPLVYTPQPAPGLPPASIDFAGMPPAAIEADLRLALDRLRIDASTLAARDFWDRWQRGSGERLAGVLRIAQELHHRGATAQDFFDAHCECGAQDPEVNLRYVDYLLARRRAAAR